MSERAAFADPDTQIDPTVAEQRRMFAFEQAKRFAHGDGVEAVLEQARKIEAYLRGEEHAEAPAKSSEAPDPATQTLHGRRRLPDGHRCRCMNLSIDSAGVAWCCRP